LLLIPASSTHCFTFWVILFLPHSKTFLFLHIYLRSHRRKTLEFSALHFSAFPILPRHLLWLGLGMAGGASRRDEAPVISSTNVFAALGSLKKKKKKADKEQGSSKAQDPQKDVFWAPAPLTSKSWADVDDEDDDDYYATTAPPESVWAAPPASETVTQNDAVAEVLIPALFLPWKSLWTCCFKFFLLSN